jgi:hypothetical protein
MKNSIFWNTTPYTPLKVNRRFGETCRFHLQGRSISQARNQHEAAGKQAVDLVLQNVKKMQLTPDDYDI